MRAKSFPHGVHPPEHKALSKDKPLCPLPPPEKVIIPLHQHFGSPAEPLVQKGDEVALGQKIGEGKTLFSASVHASVSGKVLAVEAHNHPLGRPVLSVILGNDGQDRLSPQILGCEDPFALEPAQIIQRVKDAGVVGLGGAAFPTSVKLSPPKDKPIDTVIINGCECEPLLTADYRLMLEFPEEILQGTELIRIATRAERVILAIEDNKKPAYDIFLEKAADRDIEVALVRTKYPQGAEKNLIQALLGREVPAGGLPFDVGVLVQNVGTAKAVWDAVSRGKPLYERALTVTGDGVREPKNLLVRIGTTFREAIDFCGGLTEEANILVMGGPMMGLAQWTADLPVIKGTSGILSWSAVETISEYSCIRCGRCVDHCPMRLVPTQLMKYIRHDHLAEAETWGVMDCVECGCCQYSCPANIPLVHWMRLGKALVSAARRKKSA